MLRSVSVFLTTLGVLLVVIGSASAAFVGPDDTLVIGEKTVPQRAAGLAVRTNPAITRFVNIDLLVRAEAEGGVFLASSHRVDTESLLWGRSYYEITRMSLNDIGGVVTEGPRATRRTLRPGRITGWIDQTTGSPEAELVVELDGTPLDVVAVPQRARDRVTFTIGATVAGVFWFQVAVAGIGLAMVLVGWALRRHLRRHQRRASGSRSDRPASPGSAGGKHAAADQPSTGLPKYPRGMTAEAAAPAMVAAPVVAAALAAASGATESVAATEPESSVTAPASDAPTRVVTASIAPASAPPVAAPRAAEPRASEPRASEPPATEPPAAEAAPSKSQWDKRKIILLAVLVPLSFALKGCAVPGAAPEPTRTETRTGMLLSEGQALEPKATHVYAPEFTSYPMWALVVTTEPRRARLVTRSQFAARWQTEARVRIRGPLPGTVERAIEPNAALVRRADELAAAVASWWPTGEITGTRMDRRSRRAREALLGDGASASSMYAIDPPAGTPRVRLVEVAGGHLAVLRHTLMTPAPRRLTTIAFFPTAGKPRILGSSVVEVS